MTMIAAIWRALSLSALFGPALTLLAYEAALALQRAARGSVLLNPVLVAAALVILVLLTAGIPYPDYLASADVVLLLLGPATVALAVPLYAHARQFRAAALPLVLASGIGAAVACISAVLLLALLGAPGALLASIAPKSTTMAIALGISAQIGGQPGITAVLVVSTGMLTAVLSRRCSIWPAYGIVGCGGSP